MDQLKGKARNAMGKMKDAARDAADDIRGEDIDKKDEAA
jgi:uncharacterized protein YjbJ (UPF0337 family)